MNKKIIYGLMTAIAILLLALYFLSVFDVGLNSERFIREDFNSAFLARKTGNCNLFKEYLLRDHDKWGERCLEEKDNRLGNIKNFSIQEISVSRDKAFVQVKLERDLYQLKVIAIEEGIEPEKLKELEEGYLVSYDMEKTKSGRFLGIFPQTRWVIANEFRD